MDEKIVSRPYTKEGEESYVRVFGEHPIPHGRKFFDVINELDTILKKTNATNGDDKCADQKEKGETNS